MRNNFTTENTEDTEMIEKIKIPEDIDRILKEAFNHRPPDGTYIVANNITMSALTALLVEKINEIIDVVNAERKAEIPDKVEK